MWKFMADCADCLMPSSSGPCVPVSKIFGQKYTIELCAECLVQFYSTPNNMFWSRTVSITLKNKSFGDMYRARNVHCTDTHRILVIQLFL